jgi:hypothetical protein
MVSAVVGRRVGLCSHGRNWRFRGGSNHRGCFNSGRDLSNRRRSRGDRRSSFHYRSGYDGNLGYGLDFRHGDRGDFRCNFSEHGFNNRLGWGIGVQRG